MTFDESETDGLAGSRYWPKMGCDANGRLGRKLGKPKKQVSTLLNLSFEIFEFVQISVESFISFVNSWKGFDGSRWSNCANCFARWGADASMNNKICGETQKPAQGQLRLGWQWWPRARMRGVLNV